jgi:hypothetical protein
MTLPSGGDVASGGGGGTTTTPMGLPRNNSFGQSDLNRLSWGSASNEVSLATMVMNRTAAAAATESRRDATLGQMRCLAALAEWEALGQLCAREWELSAGVGQPGAGGVGAGGDAMLRGRMAPLATQAAWHLGDWGRMEVYAEAVGGVGLGSGGAGRGGGGGGRD